ncbi:MAG: PqqD family protein, partial [Arenicellales bacterium]
PNSTGKNVAMYATWLADLGCELLPDPGSLRYDTEAVKEALWTRLVPVPDKVLPWHAVCGEADTLEPEVEGDRVVFRDEEGQTIARVDENAFTVWSFCDGNRDIGEVAVCVGAAYEEPRSAVAGDVASTVTELHRAGVLLRERREILIDVLPDETRDDWTYRRAAVVHPDRQRTDLWFAVPVEHSAALAKNADCFLLAMLLPAMSHKLSLRLCNGTVSGGLVENLMCFQERWNEWRSDFAVTDIQTGVDSSVEPRPASGRIAAFSGGLDSCYTLFRHNKALESSLPRIEVVAMVHGFDIPLTDSRGFAGAAAKAGCIADEAGAALLPLRTNVRGVYFDGEWDDRHATALAAALTVCSGGYYAGIVSSTMNVGFPAMHGSNPATDPLLGSERFQISHFGFEASRFEKFRALSRWPLAIANLRVCWRYEHRDQNCGRCHKCVIALLSLRCLGLSTDCFGNAPDDAELASLIPDKFPGGLNRYDLLELADYVRDQGIDTPWSRRLEELYVR